jgi:hypothetical protein
MPILFNVVCRGTLGRHALSSATSCGRNLYSKGRLLLILNALIIALSITYAKVTNVDRFWDVLSEHFNSIDHQQTAGRGELFQAFIGSNFEALIDK